jgi:hypothetical protein
MELSSASHSGNQDRSNIDTSTCADKTDLGSSRFLGLQSVGTSLLLCNIRTRKRTRVPLLRLTAFPLEKLFASDPLRIVFVSDLEPRFCAFDLLWCEGEDLRLFPLNERKQRLRSVMMPSNRLLYCDHIEEHGEKLFHLACAKDLEGIVAKRKFDPYTERTQWLPTPEKQVRELGLTMLVKANNLAVENC